MEGGGERGYMEVKKHLNSRSANILRIFAEILNINTY